MKVAGGGAVRGRGGETGGPGIKRYFGNSKCNQNMTDDTNNASKDTPSSLRIMIHVE